VFAKDAGTGHCHGTQYTTDSIHPDVLVSLTSVLCAVIVCGPASVFYPFTISWLLLAPWYPVTWSGLSSADLPGPFRRAINSLPRETDFTRFRTALPNSVLLRTGVRRRPEGVPKMGSSSPPTSRLGVVQYADPWRSPAFTFHVHSQRWTAHGLQTHTTV